jgi:CHAT domain-containing protein
MADTITILRHHADPQDQSLFDQLASARTQLATFTLRGPEGNQFAAYREKIKLIEEESDRLETALSARSAEFRAATQPVTPEAIQAAIPDGAVLVEFTVYQPYDAKTRKFGPTRYSAYVLAHEGEPRWVELGEAVTIDRNVTALRQALREPQRGDVKQLTRRLDEQVMRPVRALLGPTRRVLISPDGALNLIPFAALVDERNQYLVERYSISYLTSGRDLLRLQVPRQSKSEPLIVADPAFGAVAGAETQLAANIRRSPTRHQTRGPLKKFSEAYFEPLPQTGREARDIKELLPQTTVLTKDQANETALKKVSAPSILHIATHGFFLQDEEASVEKTRSLSLFGGVSDLRGSNWAAKIENPLLRSGLALAGFNQHKSGDDDGALTALEASGLDLWGTKLVVLSACDTGVGEVKNGEGVYGLRRALVLAGSESQVMSLWKVSDYVTRLWMTEYYKGLKQGQGRGEALRQVQLKMLKGREYRHPFYWASFIQSGEWANLDGQR